MIYLGGAWPAEYRDQMFMGNVHGRRLNVDMLTPKGSGYVASHGPDFLLANDAWARFINMRYGPDGNVYLIDWYDKQACHTGDAKIWDRTNGRIYKICLSRDQGRPGRSGQEERPGAGQAAAARQRLVRSPCPALVAGARRRRGGSRGAWRRSPSGTRTRRAGCADCGRCTSPAG